MVLEESSYKKKLGKIKNKKRDRDYQTWIRDECAGSLYRCFRVLIGKKSFGFTVSFFPLLKRSSIANKSFISVNSNFRDYLNWWWHWWFCCVKKSEIGEGVQKWMFNQQKHRKKSENILLVNKRIPF